MPNSDSNQRQVILVATRAKLDALVAYLEIPSIINTIAENKYFYILPFKGEKYARDYYMEVEARALAQLSTQEVLSRFNRHADLGTPAVLFNPIEARKNFDFGIGHIPKDGDIYIQHPLKFNTYVSPENFARSICAEKEAAFLRLAASLGAKSIKLISIQTTETKGMFASNFSPREIATDLGFQASFDENGGVTKEIFKEFNRPNFKAPFIAKELEPWVQKDIDLRTMANDRIEANVFRSNVKLEFFQNFGLGGELSAKIADKGLTTSGSFKSVMRSLWIFEVEYYDMSVS